MPHPPEWTAKRRDSVRQILRAKPGISQKEISNLLGIRRETVSVYIKQLRREWEQ